MLWRTSRPHTNLRAANLRRAYVSIAGKSRSFPWKFRAVPQTHWPMRCRTIERSHQCTRTQQLTYRIGSQDLLWWRKKFG